jgi:hypothetical protein
MNGICRGESGGVVNKIKNRISLILVQDGSNMYNTGVVGGLSEVVLIGNGLYRVMGSLECDLRSQNKISTEKQFFFFFFVFFCFFFEKKKENSSVLHLSLFLLSRVKTLD